MPTKDTKKNQSAAAENAGTGQPTGSGPNKPISSESIAEAEMKTREADLAAREKELAEKEADLANNTTTAKDLELARLQGKVDGLKMAGKHKKNFGPADYYVYEKGEMKYYSSKGIADLVWPIYDELGNTSTVKEIKFQKTGQGLGMCRTDCVNEQALIESHPDFGHAINPIGSKVAANIVKNMEADEKYTEGAATTKSNKASMKTDVING